MFSSGKIAFAIFFVIAFIIVITVMYRKDLKLHQREYKGAKWILLGFITFIGLLLLIKFALKG